MADDCIFCKIIRGEIPAQRLYEDERMIVIRDVNPKAKIHLLMIPKEHYADITRLDERRADDLAKCFLKLSEIQADLGISDGFRLVINRGEAAGQSVFHLHIHILSGGKIPGFN